MTASQIIVFEFFEYLFPVLVVNFVLSLISWPTSKYFFGKLSDKGYSLSSVTGLLSIAFLVFVYASYAPTSWIPLTKSTFSEAFIFWTALNIYVARKTNFFEQKFDFGQVKKINLGFLTLFVFWYLVRAHNPTLFNIERVMDFGILQSLFSTSVLPLFDMWYALAPLNYYYFGHFVAYTILELSNVTADPGFFVIVFWLFATLGTNIYRLCKDIFTNTFLSKDSASRGNRAGTLAGIFGVFFLLFAGNIEAVAVVKSYLNFFLSDGAHPHFWYADITRILYNGITEPVIYSMLESDLHAHTSGLLFGVIMLTTTYLFWKWKQKRLFLVAGVLLGMAFMTNSLDAAIYGGLFSLAVLLVHKNQKLYVIKNVILVAAIAFTVSYPWWKWIYSPFNGAGLVLDRSDPLSWWAYWGGFIIVFLLFIAKLHNQKGKQALSFIEGKKFIYLLAAYSIFLLIIPEIVYLKDLLDINEWYRVNTVFKLSTQTWLIFSVLCGSITSYILIKQNKNPISRAVQILLGLTLVFLAFYPSKVLLDIFNTHSLAGISTANVNWYINYKDSYETFKFLEELKESLPKGKKVKTILEAGGNSYTDANLMSTKLGWNNIVGWQNHEWTWRGELEPIQYRQNLVKEIYVGTDYLLAKEILTEFDVDYILISDIEEAFYDEDINYDKLLSLGDVIYLNDTAVVIRLYK